MQVEVRNLKRKKVMPMIRKVVEMTKNQRKKKEMIKTMERIKKW